MMANPPDKPLRVITAQVDLFRCPLCRDQVEARVEVEVRLGDLTLTRAAESHATADTYGLVAEVPAHTRLRRVLVDHDCLANQVAEGSPS